MLITFDTSHVFNGLLNMVAPSNKLFMFVICPVSHLEISALKDRAPRNMWCITHSRLVYHSSRPWPLKLCADRNICDPSTDVAASSGNQPAKDPLKTVAPENMACMVFTCVTSQWWRSWLKDRAEWNIYTILFTRCVFQLFSGLLKTPLLPIY